MTTADPKPAVFQPKGQAPDEVDGGGGVLFHERQPLHQNLIIRIVVPLQAIVTGGALLVVGFGAGSAHLSTFVLMFVAFGAVLPLLLLRITLETIVTDERLIVRYRPLPGRDLDAGRIIEAKAMKYSPLRDAGGWGWRISPRYHRVFNVSGDRGVLVRYGPGHKEQFLLGSRRADELAEAIGLARFNRVGMVDACLGVEAESTLQPGMRG